MSLLKPKVTVTVTNRTVIRVMVLIFISFLVFRFLGRITHVLTLILIAGFLALALNPAVSWIAARLKSRSRAQATAVAYLAVLAVLISFIILVIPPLVRQTADFVTELPDTVESFQTQDSSTARFVRKYKLDEQLQDISQDIRNHVPSLRSKLLNTAGRVGSALISIITVLVLTFMLLVEGPIWIQKLWEVHPAETLDRHRKLALRMYRVVTGYVNGQLIIAIIAATFAMVALLIASSILDVSVNAVALAGIVALGGLIPMFGNTIAAVLVVAVCLFSSLPLAIVMAVFFLLYQQIENITIQPIVQAKHNELTPLLVFIAALLGIGWGGLLGALIAIPAVGCIKILVEDYFSRRRLKPEAQTD